MAEKKVKEEVIIKCNEWTKVYDDIADMDKFVEELKERRSKKNEIDWVDILLTIAFPIPTLIRKCFRDNKRQDEMIELLAKFQEKQAEINKLFADYAIKGAKISNEIYDMSKRNAENNVYVLEVLENWINNNSDNKYLENRVEQVRELEEKIKNAKPKKKILGLF